jgi:ribosomal protein S18 acetylase RimI-like enzyme
VADERAVRRAVEAHGPFVAALYGGEIESHEDFYIAHNRWVDEPEWNHAGQLRLAAGELDRRLDEIRRDLRAFGRAAAILLDPLSSPADLAGRLRDLGWVDSFRHSGLIWPQEKLPLKEVEWPAGVALEEMRSASRENPEGSPLPSMEAFASVFEASFAETAEGHLSAGYRTALPASLRARVAGVEVVHTLVRIDGEPAAIGSRAERFGVAGLYNLGVAPRFRRLGLGGAITLHRVAAAQAAGAEVVYLLTEDSRVEASQLRRGFERAFELLGWSEPEPHRT